MVKPCLGTAVVAVLCAACIRAQAAGELQVTPHGLGSFEVGQIVSGSCLDPARPAVDTLDTSFVWQQKAVVQMGLDAKISERSRVVVSAEAALRFSFPQKALAFETINPVWYIYMNQADMTSTFGDSTRSLVLEAGYAPYKYNRDARNLGEYLFRTGTYPPYIITTFDEPFSRLLGLRAGGELSFADAALSRVGADILVTSATAIYPTQNISFSLLPRATFGHGLVDIGAGVSFANAISVFGKTYVSPKVTDNMYLTDVVRDAVADTILRADTNYYTFRGLKLMARASLDPKRIWAPDGEFGIFGPQDLRLYFETAVLGVKNYPPNRDSTVRYDDITKRWPVMVGLNLPTFKVLDVFAVEFEYFGSDIPNDFQRVEYNRIPTYKDPKNYGSRDFSADNVKWSFYAMKALNAAFSLRVQVACDHMRINMNNLSTWDREENLRSTSQWYYMVKMQYGF